MARSLSRYLIVLGIAILLIIFMFIQFWLPLERRLTSEDVERYTIKQITFNPQQRPPQIPEMMRGGAVVMFFAASDESGKLKYGQIRVEVPPEHRIGEVEMPKDYFWYIIPWKEEFDPERHFSMEVVSNLTKGDFSRSISARRDSDILNRKGDPPALPGRQPEFDVFGSPP